MHKVMYEVLDRTIMIRPIEVVVRPMKHSAMLEVE